MVAFRDHFSSRNFFYLVLEYVPGENLYNSMRNGPPLSTSDIKHIFIKILGVFKYLHSHGVVMRDLKPENILVSPDKKIVKLCDFGWASFVDDKAWLMKMAGTYSYMAPEALRSEM